MSRAHPWPWLWWGAGARPGGAGTERSVAAALRCRRWSSLGLRGRWRKWFLKEMRCEHSTLPYRSGHPPAPPWASRAAPQSPGAGRGAAARGCGVAAALGSCPQPSLQPQLTTGTTEQCWSWAGQVSSHTSAMLGASSPLCCWPKAAPQHTLQSPALGTLGSVGWQRPLPRTSPALLLFLFISKGLKT